MSVRSRSRPQISAQEAFDPAKRQPADHRRKRPTPFSLRLTDDERGQLEAAAGGRPLSAYVRSRLFETGERPRRRARPEPVVDAAALAQVLAMLGASRLPNNLNQLAKAANMGTLPLTPEVEEDLTKACAAVLAMKAELMRALGRTSGEDP